MSFRRTYNKFFAPKDDLVEIKIKNNKILIRLDSPNTPKELWIDVMNPFYGNISQLLYRVEMYPKSKTFGRIEIYAFTDKRKALGICIGSFASYLKRYD